MNVTRVSDQWEATCEHGDEEWVIRREAEHLAVRSLKAHQAECIYHAMRTELAPDDQHHPLSVLGTRTMMLAEDYDLDLPPVLDLAYAAAFLERNLTKVAQDENQEFARLAREIRTCRKHLEAVWHDSQTPERGAFCPTCQKADPPRLVRLVREYPHFCTDEDCTQQFHPTTDDLDVWVCPANPEHWWNQQGYADYLKERMGA